MIPMLLGSALTVGRITVNAVAVGSIAGSAYGMGRKYGRVICEKLDEISSFAHWLLLRIRQEGRLPGPSSAVTTKNFRVPH